LARSHCARSRQTNFAVAARRGGQALRLGDLAALDAVGADADALGSSVDQGVDSLQVGVPATPCDVVRVRDVIAELRTFAAYVAYLCHGSNSRVFAEYFRAMPEPVRQRQLTPNARFAFEQAKRERFQCLGRTANSGNAASFFSPAPET